MASTETIRTVVGIIGNIISLGLFLSPLPTFVTICKKKDVERFSPVPYLATLLNCFLWVLYGLPIVHPDSTLVLTINGAGIAIELCYIIMFVMFGPKQRVKVVLTVLAEAAAVVIIGALVIKFLPTTERRSTVVGILCIIFCIMMYVAPLAVMKMVIQTKSVEYMPLYLSLAACCNGTCWTIYSLLKFDINILMVDEMWREDAVKSLVYEAYARLKNPVYGCTIAISHLQKCVKELEEQLKETQEQLLKSQEQMGQLSLVLDSLHFPSTGMFDDGNFSDSTMCHNTPFTDPMDYYNMI